MSRAMKWIASAAIGVVCLTLPNMSPLAGPSAGATTPSALEWSLMPAPTPTQQVNDLVGLSCTSATFCMSVGPISNDGSGARAYEWNGSSWDPTSVPDGTNRVLWSVSCLDQDFCVAVGGGLDASGTGSENTVAYEWNGSMWSEMTMPAGSGGYLQGVSCASTSDCEAVGWASGGTQSALIEHWSDSTWSVVPNPDTGVNSYLGGVSCLQSDFCVAVGYQATSGSSTASSLIEQWDGSQWVLVASPNVANVANEPVSVSCSSVTLCVAVGETLDSSNQSGALIDMWDGESWTNVTSPASGANQLLEGVDCYSQSACLASGAVGTANLVLMWDGSGWTVDAAPSIDSASYSALGSMSCVSGWACVVEDAASTGVFFVDSSIAPVLPPTTTAASTDVNAVAHGAPVIYQAVVSGDNETPDGSVIFSIGTTTLCSAALSPGEASCTASDAPVSSSDTVTATYSGSATYAPSSGTTTLSVAPADPSPPAGATAWSSGASGPNGVASATSADITGSGSGYGSLTVASYGSNPTAASLSDGTGTYYDVKVSPGSSFGSVTLTLCDQGSANSIDWFDGSSWIAFSDQSISDGCLVATVTSSTVPTIAELTGTPVALAYVPVVQPPPPLPSHGYWLVGSDGGIFTFGSAQFYGSTGSLHLQRPVVGIVPTADRGGYWLDASDGGVFSFGDTQFYGSIPGLGLHPAGSGLPNSLNAPIVGMVPSNDDRGYFMVASDGGVFAFGDAHFAGSCPGIGGCSGSAVAVMPDHSGDGYWVVTTTGSVYTFGDAPYFGAPGHGNVTSAVAAPDGKGYWVLLSDGEVFGYGDAANLGSPSSASFNGFDAATAIFATTDGAGYWVSSALGAVFNYGDAPNDGGMSGTHLNGSIIAATGF